MCGSGTILIEAALIARNMSPGVFRKEYAFEKWPDYDQELFDNIYNDDSQEREFEHKIYGYDIDQKAVNTARINIKAAGLSNDIIVDTADFENFTQPKEKSIIIMNPPYGERISTPNLLGTYKMIGERLKHQFLNNDAWVLSYREECFEQIGLKPSIKIPLYNGSLECEFRKYQIFDGKMKTFREGGNEIKTDEERKAMAEKHRFKTVREFKKRLDEPESDDDDIRSFTFHTPFDNDRKKAYGKSGYDRPRSHDDYDDNRRKSHGKEGGYEHRDKKPYGKSSGGGYEHHDRKYDKGGAGKFRNYKDGGKKYNRYNDDED
jgi:putative N6-adenine-specific DNA methylase